MEKKKPGTVWERIKEALRDARRPDTQKEAARLARVSQPSVSEWNEPGKFPAMENIVPIAKATHYCVEWLLTGEGFKYRCPDDGPSQHLWSLWWESDPAQRAYILSAVKAAQDQWRRINSEEDQDGNQDDLQRT